MPTNPAEAYSTAILSGYLKGTVALEEELTNEQIGEALLSRLIPNDYIVVELRGGTRPTQQPLNP